MSREDRDVAKPSQRTVPASGATPALGRSSVFDVPKPEKRAYTRLAPIDLSNVKIDEGVPIPPARAGARAVSPWYALLSKLEIGASFAVPSTHHKALGTAMRNFKRKRGGDFTMRLVDAESRIWRTA